MNIEAILRPTGRIQIRAAQPDAVFSPLESSLAEAFAQSTALGLLELAGVAFEQVGDPGLSFWRVFARKAIQSICQLGESVAQSGSAIQPPPLEQWTRLIESAPPMVGLDHLVPEVLTSHWLSLVELILERSQAHPGGLSGFLATIDPLFHLVGRVHFHLAENKANAERPFAFLATYTTRLNQSSKVQHLPLGQALKEFARAEDQARLEALLRPVREAASNIPLVRELLQNQSLFAPQSWTIPQAHRFLSQSVAMEEAGIIVRVPDWWTRRTQRRPEVRVRLGTKAPTGIGLDALLDFEIEVALDGETLTSQEIKQLQGATEGLALLRGHWVEVDPLKIQQALGHWKRLQDENPDGVSFIQGMRMLAGAAMDRAEQIPEAQAGWSRIVEGSWLETMLGDLRAPGSSRAIEPGQGLLAQLRPYQVEGVKWLDFMTRLGLGACLADDMGLGKTIQVIDLIWQDKRRAESHGEPAPPPSLIVAPASLLGNWKSEIERFAPRLKTIVIHRSEQEASTLDRIAQSPEEALAGVDVAVTTYAFVVRAEWIAARKWRLVILDEAQAIKNASTAQTRAVKAIPCSGRIVLTGTPVENHLGDLWSIFDFCCPGLLGNATQFRRFVKSAEKSDLDANDPAQNRYAALRRLVRPYILRRTKTDPNIISDLPQKTEMRVDCPLSKKQAILYAKALANLEQKLESSEGMARRGLVLSSLMQLKQICNHPDLFLQAVGFAPAESGKFDRLGMLCEPIRERQEKVLVFTQFQSMTQPLHDYLASFFAREGLILHGGTTVKKRPELVKRFQDPEGPPFFVISLKAGGTGLNLTAANHVVHFDRWWNPAVENQATDRAFRIGQKRNVLVHKFVCRGTVEERIDQMIAGKTQLADQILSEEGTPLLTEMSNREILDFVALDVERAVGE